MLTGWLVGDSAYAAPGGEFTIRIVDAKTNLPTAARIHLKKLRGRTVRQKDAAFWHDHFVIDGAITLELPGGTYLFELERGLEYKTYTGHFEIGPNASDEETIELHRFADLAAEGWYSGDLHIHRSADDIDKIMRAEDLQVAPLIAWHSNGGKFHTETKSPQGPTSLPGGRFFDLRSGEDERDGGALLYHRVNQAPQSWSTLKKNFPPSSQLLVEMKRQAGVHVDAEKPFWWDFPIWLASGRLDSVGVLNNHLWRDGGLDNEAWGRPRDRLLFPPPHGNGRWSEKIYYHALEAGLRIAPSAGSASGILPNPVGYNRVYVHCGEKLDYDRWWTNLREGKVFVTNGPLLRARVAGQLPGHVFQASKGDKLELHSELTLSTREKIEYLEIVKNGRPAIEVRLDRFVQAGGRLQPLVFEESGWFLIRAVTNNKKTYRYASTGPFYVEFDDQPRVSRQAAEFFLDWTEEIAKTRLPRDEAEKKETLRYLRSAQKYWQARRDEANAD